MGNLGYICVGSSLIFLINKLLLSRATSNTGLPDSHIRYHNSYTSTIYDPPFTYKCIFCDETEITSIPPMKIHVTGRWGNIRGSDFIRNNDTIEYYSSCRWCSNKYIKECHIQSFEDNSPWWSEELQQKVRELFEEKKDNMKKNQTV